MNLMKLLVIALSIPSVFASGPKLTVNDILKQTEESRGVICELALQDFGYCLNQACWTNRIYSCTGLENFEIKIRLKYLKSTGQELKAKVITRF